MPHPLLTDLPGAWCSQEDFVAEIDRQVEGQVFLIQMNPLSTVDLVKFLMEIKGPNRDRTIATWLGVALQKLAAERAVAKS